jgi:hypothetical protein
VPEPFAFPRQATGLDVPDCTTGSFVLTVLLSLLLLAPPPMAILPDGHDTVTVVPSEALPLTTMASA